MELQETPQDSLLSVTEPADIEQIAGVLQELIEKGLISEAMARFLRLRSPDQADVMARLTSDTRVILLSLLPVEEVGLIIEELDTDEAVEISQEMEVEQLSHVLDETSPENPKTSP